VLPWVATEKLEPRLLRLAAPCNIIGATLASVLALQGIAPCVYIARHDGESD
jgi:hypothetical protein